MGATKLSSADVHLFNPDLLKGLDWVSVYHTVNPKISNEEPGESWLEVRPLRISDYEKGFLQLLSQLTSVGNISQLDFQRRFWEMKSSGGYFITVIEDTRIGKIIGAATLTTELKFIHNCALKARLEDVVVNNTYRGKQLGKLIVLTVTLLAKQLSCYKMVLECKDDLIPFYKTLGYKLEPGNANAMAIRYENSSKVEGVS